MRSWHYDEILKQNKTHKGLEQQQNLNYSSNAA